MSDFLETVNRAFHDLIARGDFSIESSHYDDRAFGNAVVVIAGKGFRIRLQRDRGDMSADAASVSEPADWAPLERVLEAVEVADVRPEGLLTPTEAADLVRAYLVALETGFSVARVDQTRRKLEELRRQRLAEALKLFHQAPDETGA